MNAPTPDANLIAELVVLRALLDAGHAQSRDTTVIGRHLAVVVLDGVSERAMGVVLDHKGVALGQQPKFDNLVDAIRKLATDRKWDGPWEPMIRALRQLHQARNKAQHQGITADHAQLTGWAAAVDTFLVELVHVAFGVDLRTVTLAAAVRNEQLRNALARAEHEVTAGNFRDCLRRTLDVFAIARGLWRYEQLDAIGHLYPPDPIIGHGMGVFESAETRNAVFRSSDLAEVQPFAADLGEYVWLTGMQAVESAGAPVNVDDARRALAFVYGWILRWEQFSATYTSGRVGDWRAQQRRAPQTDEPADSPTLTSSAIVQAPGSAESERIDVTLQLANVPAHFTPRAVDMHGLFRSLRDDADVDVWLGDGGALSLRMSSDADVGAIVTAIDSALLAWRTADSERRQALAAGDAALTAALPAYQRALGEVSRQAAIPLAEITGVVLDPAGGGRPRFQIVVALDDQPVASSKLGWDAFSRAAEELGLDLGGPVIPGLLDAGGWKIPETVTPEQAAQWARRSYELVGQHRAQDASERAERDELAKTVRQRFLDALSGRPTVTPRALGDPS